VWLHRHSTCDIQIQSKFISRQHAVIKRNENEQYVLHHLSSTNPSVVNGEPITSGDRVLRDKDVLIFADKTFYFRAPRKCLVLSPYNDAVSGDPR
jgi:pSer/pThr/pTyr-binding forkhead associated (FHA) protein